MRHIGINLYKIRRSKFAQPNQPVVSVSYIFNSYSLPNHFSTLLRMLHRAFNRVHRGNGNAGTVNVETS